MTKPELIAYLGQIEIAAREAAAALANGLDDSAHNTISDLDAQMQKITYSNWFNGGAFVASDR